MIHIYFNNGYSQGESKFFLKKVYVIKKGDKVMEKILEFMYEAKNFLI